MSLSVFRCWPDDDGESGKPGRAVPALDARQAAEIFAEDRWPHSDYPDEQRVWVRGPDEKATIWTVAAEQTVTFHARMVFVPVTEPAAGAMMSGPVSAATEGGQEQ
jgi:hypothetical protein